jgi:DNA polymerase III subunit delta
MPQLSLSRALEKLRAQPSSATVFLHGEEEFLREEGVREVLSVVLDSATRDFNLDQLRGSDADPETLASMLATPPMMANYRVVLVRDAQGLSPKAREAVEQFLERPSPGSVLILSGTIPSGSKAKFYGTLKKEALAVEMGAMDEADLPGWLASRALERHGVEIEMGAARALSAAIGPQLGILSTELEKAVSYVSGRERITLEDVKAVGGYIPRVDRWAWFDCVGDRRYAEALSQLASLLESGENGVGLVIGLGSHMLKIGLLVGGGREALDRSLRPHQRWLANRLQPQAAKWTVAEVDAAMEELLRADRLLKSAPLTDRQVMEELLLRLAAGAARPHSEPRRVARAG